MQYNRNNKLFAVFFTFALHAAVFAFAGKLHVESPDEAVPAKSQERMVFMAVVPAPPAQIHLEPPRPPAASAPAPVPALPDPARPRAAAAVPARARQETPANLPAAKKPASMAAPPAPTAEEWVFAARYTNKNSKGYRYSWGKQVRSMMGTAVEGPGQGEVRFRVEIAPDGSLARLETLWTTSAAAEKLARKAVEAMPRLPPTPTGKPLVFDKTISFTATASEAPPSYRDDCLPDPPIFHNPFAWDGKSPQVPGEPEPVEKLDPKALEECLKQLPQDSIDAEMSRDKQQMDRWGWKN